MPWEEPIIRLWCDCEGHAVEVRVDTFSTKADPWVSLSLWQQGYAPRTLISRLRTLWYLLRYGRLPVADSTLLRPLACRKLATALLKVEKVTGEG